MLKSSIRFISPLAILAIAAACTKEAPAAEVAPVAATPTVDAGEPVVTPAAVAGGEGEGEGEGEAAKAPVAK